MSEPSVWERQKAREVQADNERIDGKERVCRYANNIVLRVALPKPCPTF